MLISIVGKYSESWMRRRFSDNYGEEIYVCMRESSEQRRLIDEFQMAVESCLHNLLFSNEKEYRFLKDMEYACSAFGYLPEEIEKCMEHIGNTDDLEIMLCIANEICGHTNGLRNAIGVITELEISFPIMLNINTRQIVQKPCRNLLQGLKALHDKVCHFTSQAVPALEAYKREIDKEEQKLLEALQN